MGCHTCWLNYFTLVCLWCGRTVGRSVYGHVITKFPRMGSLSHFFTHGAPRASRARAPLWWWWRGCHEEWGSIKTVVSHACSTNKGRRVLHKRQNLIQDDESLAQNLTKKTAVRQQNKLGSKDINYLSFFLNKQRTDFLEIVKKVKENKFGLDKIVARLLYYSTLPLLCYTFLFSALLK